MTQTTLAHPEPPNDPRYFHSSDLGCCAALITNGYSLVSLSKQASGRTTFIMLRSESIQEAVDAYWADTLSVRARKYFDTLRMLKNRIYGER